MKFYVFIEIHVQHFKCETQMISELKVLFYSHDVVLVFRIVISKFLEYFHLNQALIMKSLFVSDDFHCNLFLFFMIDAFQAVPKRSFPKFGYDLISISNMISDSILILSRLIVKVVVSVSSWGFHSVLKFSVKNGKKVDCRVIADFFEFIFKKVFLKIIKYVVHAHWEI